MTSIAHYLWQVTANHSYTPLIAILLVGSIIVRDKLKNRERHN